MIVQNDEVLYYDTDFTAKVAKLGELIDSGDRNALRIFIIDTFGKIFRVFQHYANRAAEPEWKDIADGETLRELSRPLSLRQYRMIERSFSPFVEYDDDAIRSLWNFLDDYGRIHDKKIMSTSEIFGCSLIYEQVCRRLSPR
ncbi:MAG: hypothetical protein J6Z80_03305 [Clostridia bacterium]|nr:hypothetical protein [Clostridia bacterium]